jgi:ferrous iron transport protein A
MDVISSRSSERTEVQINTSGPTVPLSLMKQGEKGVVMKVSGKEEVRKFLNGLGFTAGAEVKIVCLNNTGLILDVKGSRIAVDSQMASRIYVCG